GTVPRVSFYQALDPARMLPPGALRGKVVLVGLTLGAGPGAPATDSFRTPLTALGLGLMPGVEVQAQALATLLADDWIRPAPAWLLALLACLAAPAAVLAVRGRRVAVAAATAGLAMLLPPGLAGAALTGGLWIAPA